MVEVTIDTFRKNPSLCIPRVNKDIKWMDVKNVFSKLFDVKLIDRIDVIDKKDFKRVFIHFKYWPDTEEVKVLKEHLIKYNEFRVVYEYPHYWKCYISRVAKPRRKK